MAHRSRRMTPESGFPNADPSDLDSLLSDFINPVASPRLSVDDAFVRDVLPELEDNRRFSPEASFTAPIAAPGVRAQRRLDVPHAFAAPDHTAVCVRRKQRREVLHALKRTRRGGGGARRRNFLSDVKC